MGTAEVKQAKQSLRTLPEHDRSRLLLMAGVKRVPLTALWNCPRARASRPLPKSRTIFRIVRLLLVIILGRVDSLLNHYVINHTRIACVYANNTHASAGFDRGSTLSFRSETQFVDPVLRCCLHQRCAFGEMPSKFGIVLHQPRKCIGSENKMRCPATAQLLKIDN